MTQQTEPLSPYLTMLRLMGGMFITQAIYVAADLGIADLLADGPKSSAELAQATGADERALYRVLRSLVSMEVFTEAEEGRFALTPLGETLRTGAHGSLRELVRMTCYDDYWSAIGGFSRAVKTGGAAFEQVMGKDIYAYLAEHPDKARIFQAGMAGYGGPASQAVAAAYDFSRVSHLVDVGGGNGTYLRTILAANPGLRGTLFDHPQVIEGARRLIAEDAAMKDRIDLVAGDFFAEVPAGGDAYILENIFHNWSDERSLVLLGNIHRAMAEGAKLLIVEPVISPRSQPFFAEHLDVIMLAVFGKHCGERTEAELVRLLGAAGFQYNRLWPTSSVVSLVEAERIS
jgi:hypothetical protein